MLWNAKNGIVHFPDSDMEYIRFGTGENILIMLPGLGDGLRSVKGLALPTAALYRKYAKDYTVYMFSRKLRLPQGCTTRDMARHLMQAMKALNIPKADLLGVSMGGMIAQHFAADYPDMVNKLILVVTCPRPNPILTEAITEWKACALADDHPALMDSNLRRIYSETYYRKNKWMVPITGKLAKPKSYDRFLIMADACLTHDAFDRLSAITAPTFVLGGEQDHCLGGEPSREIASHIPGAKLKMYPQWGHGLYEEAADFNDTVLEFLR